MTPRTWLKFISNSIRTCIGENLSNMSITIKVPLQTNRTKEIYQENIFLVQTLTMSQVSLPSKCCLGSYLKSARFCDGGKELPLEVKLTKLPGFSTFDPPFTLVDWFLDRFLGERLLGRAPKALGGGEDGRLIEAGEDDSVEGSVSKPSGRKNQ